MTDQKTDPTNSAPSNASALTKAIAPPRGSAALEGPDYPPEADDEQFCPRCLAGLDSRQHAIKCEKGADRGC